MEMAPQGTERTNAPENTSGIDAVANGNTKAKRAAKKAMEAGKKVRTYLDNLDKRTDISGRVLDRIMLNDEDDTDEEFNEEDLHLGIVSFAGILCAAGALFGAAIVLIGLLP